MAGRVAYAEEHRGVASLCILEGLLSPGVPVDGVVCVLLEVRAFLVYEAVGVLRQGLPRLGFGTAIIIYCVYW